MVIAKHAVAKHILVIKDINAPENTRRRTRRSRQARCRTGDLTQGCLGGVLLCRG